MSAKTTESGENKGFCVHCVSGFRIPGEPKGQMEVIHGLSTYVAQPANPSSDSASKAIIYFYDAFGLKLDNNKIIPDKLADATGLTVYVPDIFNGGGVPESALASAPSTAEEMKSASFMSKLKTGAAMAKAGPFFAKNLPAFKIPTLKKWIEQLKESKGYSKLGGTGFCYGGKLVIALNATGHINVSVANHPSMVTKGDVASIKNAILFNCAEEDPMFAEAYAKQVEKEWSEKGDKPPHKFVYYPNTVHGFAARPNLGDKLVKEAFEKAFVNSVDFWKAHL
ncbi:related to AIM2 - cytoplasmic protein involved in mitochondrial function or organization [Melanopsichium pennsylvanicum]|uniref:Related to AIM2 - cytoplasmic protein involved in mitochondrial function or organization n=2 Tax=Melanopsichium pennsylvanicum TaxID=63383 RepID=A0AAJ5C512_9BASI|nr:alpha beta-hydrolase [Melanopsichium pennsylvanicum 4]SNX84240.1 related to AIM2 - cytoplasmic protein involved in mitochondrial function or organization [Melanopsichium pennsylvanicum]